MVAGGTQLVINANCHTGGYVDVEMTDQQDNVIEGFSRAAVDRFTGNAIAHRVKWGQSDRWPHNQVVKVRFWMRNADLFSFRFAD